MSKSDHTNFKPPSSSSFIGYWPSMISFTSEALCRVLLAMDWAHGDPLLSNSGTTLGVEAQHKSEISEAKAGDRQKNPE